MTMVLDELFNLRAEYFQLYSHLYCIAESEGPDFASEIYDDEFKRLDELECRIDQICYEYGIRIRNANSGFYTFIFD